MKSKGTAARYVRQFFYVYEGGRFSGLPRCRQFEYSGAARTKNTKKRGKVRKTGEVYGSIGGMNVIDEIKKEFEIPGAFESWALYREQVTDLILASVSQPDLLQEASPQTSIQDVECSRRPMPTSGTKATGSIALFGIGPANDIDLRRLSERFERITLIDLDREGMERGLVRYGLQHCPKVALWDTSLSGVTMEDVAAFFETLYDQVVRSGRALTEAAFMEMSQAVLEQIRRKVFATREVLRARLPKEHYDMVVSVGLHSQFWSILSYSWLTLAGNVEEQILGHAMNHDPFFEALRAIDDQFIPVLNEVMLSMGDRVIIAVEEDEAHPVEGAFQSMQDIRQHYPDVQEKRLHWPFRPEEGKSYEMLFQIIGQTEVEH